MKIKVLELFDNLKIKVYEDGNIETLYVKKYGKRVMPNE